MAGSDNSLDIEIVRNSSGHNIGDINAIILEDEGVEHIFGLSGGAAIPIFDALYDSKIKLVLVRHEQGATHMADGLARATGKSAHAQWA